jgi:hypothetical protein
MRTNVHIIITHFTYKSVYVATGYERDSPGSISEIARFISIPEHQTGPRAQLAYTKVAGESLFGSRAAGA